MTIPPGGYGPRRELDHLWVSLTGSVIDAVRLEEAGPYWAGLAWHRHCVNSVSGVLESILDGTYTVAKNGLLRRPTFQRLGRVFVADSSGGAAEYEWGGQWQTTVTVNRHAVELQANLSWSQEWVVGFYRANQPSTMLSFVGLQLDTASGLVVPSGSRSTLQRVDWEGDAAEAHNLWPGAGSHAAVLRSLVAGSTGNTCSYGPGQANVWRTAASWLRADARAYGVRNRGRGAQNIKSAASSTSGARFLSGAEASAGHSQPSRSPAATRHRPDGGCGSSVHGAVALLGAAPRARPGLRVGARPKCRGSTGGGGARESVGYQRVS